MTALLRAEVHRTASLRSSWACLIAFALLVTSTAWTLANNLRHDLADGALAPGTTPAVIDVIAPTLELALGLLVALTMLSLTSEIATGSLRGSLMATPRRVRLLAARTTVVAVLGVVATTASTALAVEIARANLGTSAIQVSMVDLLPRSALVAATSSIVVVGLAALIGSSVGTLAAGFGLLSGTLIVGSSVGAWLPGRTIDTVLTAGLEPAAVARLLVWAAVVWAVGAWALVRRGA